MRWDYNFTFLQICYRNTTYLLNRIHVELRWLYKSAAIGIFAKRTVNVALGYIAAQKLTRPTSTMLLHVVIIRSWSHIICGPIPAEGREYFPTFPHRSIVWVYFTIVPTLHLEWGNCIYTKNLTLTLRQHQLQPSCSPTPFGEITTIILSGYLMAAPYHPGLIHEERQRW